MIERTKKIAYCIMILAACAMVDPGNLCADAAPEVLVTVGQETITRADLASKTATMPPQIRGRFETKAGRQQLLEQVVLISLLSQEARRLGIDKQEKVEKKIKEMTDNLIVQELTRQEISEEVTVSDEEVAAYYHENKKDFVRAEQINVSLIMFATTANSTSEQKEQKQKLACKTLKRLKKGADFAEVAREMSEDKRTQRRGGVSGFFARGRRAKMYGEKFEEVAFALKTGEMSDVFETERGYYIILVGDRQPRTEQSLSQAKSKIARKLQQLKQREAYESYVEGLKEKYPVKYSK
jgi:peptidyl-prolyl cis-trans isomerase C